MKGQNNILKISLLLAALLLWGIIGFRIYQNMTSTNLDGMPQTGIKNTLPKRDSLYSDRLSLRYPDPFFNNEFEVNGNVKKISRKQNAGAQLLPNWPLIQFRGTITKDKKTIALISINGTEMFLTKGATVNNIQLISITRDSVLLTFNKQKRYFNK